MQTVKGRRQKTEDRSSEVQESRSSGVQKFRSSGVQEFRNLGTAERRSTAWGGEGFKRSSSAWHFNKMGSSSTGRGILGPKLSGVASPCNSLPNFVCSVPPWRNCLCALDPKLPKGGFTAETQRAQRSESFRFGVVLMVSAM